MTSVRELHDKAIAFGHLAFTSRGEGESRKAVEYARQAYEMEARAAALVPEGRESEPTRSILYRSAASFAFQAEDFEGARRMAALGLAGHPSPRVQRELMALLDQIKFYTYLQDNGETLEPGELLMAIHGNAVGIGVVPYKEFKDRIESIIRLVDRTVQRLMKREYQSGGRVAGAFHVFDKAIAVPAAQNSFAMMLRLIRREDEHQTNMLVYDAQQVLDEVLLGVRLINDNREDDLRVHIDNDDYYRNFVAAVQGIAPDGVRVSNVALTSPSERVGLTRIQRSLHIEPASAPDSQEPPSMREIEAVGVLRYADDRFKEGEQIVGLESDDGNKVYIKAGAGIDELVERYWKQLVVVRGHTDGEFVYATEILPLDLE